MKSYNKYIDHTLLKPASTKEQLVKLCEEAKENDFATVCVNPCWISTCADLLKGTDVKVCTVIGFPLGAMTSEAKAFECRDAIEKGASEIDMVINIGAVKDGNKEYVVNDIKAVREAAKDHVLKVIIETCLLSDEEKVFACQACMEAGADFVKTSTGFSTSGATPADVALMKKTVGDTCKVKAAGGVRSFEDLEEMIAAGADRIGTSSGVALLKGQNANGGY